MSPATLLAEQVVLVLSRHAEARGGRKAARGVRKAAPGEDAGIEGEGGTGLSGSIGTGGGALGMDLTDLCSAVREEQVQTAAAQRIPHWQHPQREVRLALVSLLRSGRVRRSLASGGRPDNGDVEAMLRLLVLNCLQVTGGPEGRGGEGMCEVVCTPLASA